MEKKTKRTQILLEPSLYQVAWFEAKRQNMSLGAWIREAMRAALTNGEA